MSNICCDSETIPFADESVTTIDYSPDRQAKYGAYPRVMVAYHDEEDDSWQVAGQFNARLDGDVLTIDHTGPSTGFIKLS